MGRFIATRTAITARRMFMMTAAVLPKGIRSEPSTEPEPAAFAWLEKFDKAEDGKDKKNASSERRADHFPAFGSDKNSGGENERERQNEISPAEQGVQDPDK